MARRGKERGRAGLGVAGHGAAWRGAARPGEAGLGEAGRGTRHGAARRGGGMGESAPRTLFQTISLSSRSSAASSFEKSIASDCFAPQAAATLRSSSGTVAGRHS